MNLIKRIVKEAVLLPYRVLQGIDAAVGEDVDSEKEKEKK